jgi:hypothetical protein
VRLAPELAWQLIDGEGVVVDLPHRNVLGLNPTASAIWGMIGHRSEDEMAAELARRFEVDEAAARADVREFLAVLEARGFLSQA